MSFLTSTNQELRYSLVLTLGFEHVASVDLQCNARAFHPVAFGHLLILVLLIQHLLSSLGHDLFEAHAREPKLEDLRLFGRSLQDVLALVVVVEGFFTKLVSKYHY